VTCSTRSTRSGVSAATRQRWPSVRGYAFDETTVNADDLIIGPNIAIPVNGSPRDFLFPLPIADVPASGYSEEQAIASDIESTSGISDPVTGGEGNGPASQTATGVQLVQQAAGLRIQNKTRRLGSEIIVPGGDAWVLLNQTKILEPRPVRVPNEDGGLNQPAWTMRKLGPYELRGRMAISMDDGSTMAKNVPQMRQDAQMLQTLSQDPLVDQQKLRVQILAEPGDRERAGVPCAAGAAASRFDGRGVPCPDEHSG
jgi:hypothetical protein